jgi:hypothetical protein
MPVIIGRRRSLRLVHGWIPSSKDASLNRECLPGLAEIALQNDNGSVPVSLLT